MKKIFVLLLVLLLLLAACREKPSEALRTALLGTWQIEYTDQTMKLEEDGWGVFYGRFELRYEWLSGSRLRIVHNPNSPYAYAVDYDVEVDEETLRLTWRDGDFETTQTFTRIE